MCFNMRSFEMWFSFLSHHMAVWLAYWVYCAFVCLFVCLFVRLQISQRQKKDSDMKLHMLVPLLPGMLFLPFWWTLALGTAPPEGKNFSMPIYKWQLGKKIYGEWPLVNLGMEWGRHMVIGGICVLHLCFSLWCFAYILMNSMDLTVLVMCMNLSKDYI